MKTAKIVCDKCKKEMERPISFLDSWDAFDTADELDPYRITLELCEDCQDELQKWLKANKKVKKKGFFS